jgi:hypothetical protein
MDHSAATGIPGGVGLPVKQKLIGESLIAASDPENTYPNSSQKDGVSLSSSDSQHAPIATTHAAPFLEMEDENDDDDLDDFHDALLEEIPLNNVKGYEEGILPPADDSLANRGAPLEEEKKEDDERFLSPSSSPVPLSGQSHSRSVNENEITCGKRPRNSRKVSFAPAVVWSGTLIPYAAASTSPLQQDSSGSNHKMYNNSSLLQIRDTIHLSDYTIEERLATWYTFADLKSFKNERKDTARQIDSGLLSLPLAAMREIAPQTTEPVGHSDMYIDLTSSLLPVVYCSRGVENCTETISRIRYRHIAIGWRAVLNTQEKHNFHHQKLSSLSTTEQNHYKALASLLGIKAPKSWFSYKAKGSGDSPKKRDPMKAMCCPYELAAAYLPTSEASLTIARKRAIGDERDVKAWRAQDQLKTDSAVTRSNHHNPNTAVASHSVHNPAATHTSVLFETGARIRTVLEYELSGKDDNHPNAEGTTKTDSHPTKPAHSVIRIMDV